MMSTEVQPHALSIATMVANYWDRLRPEMESHGWGIQQMADAIGVSFQAIAKVRDGGSLGTTNNIKAAKKLGVNPIWLATGEGPKHQPASAPHEAPVADGGEPELIIEQYEETGGGMGRGFNLADSPPGHIRSWKVTPEWLRLNVPSHTGFKNLAIVTGFGPSMKPMFNPGDPLLVDTGVKVIDHEGVYFFRVGDEGFIKLIQRVPEFDGPGVRLRVISKNPDFPPYDLSPKNPHFEVLGKVLTVWRSEQF